MEFTLRFAPRSPQGERRTVRIAIPVLAASLVLNVALGWLVLTRERPSGSEPTSAVPPAVGVTRAPASDAHAWQRLAAPAATDLVARLRAAGFPADMIRAILEARFKDELYATMQALDPEMTRRPFWKNSQQNPQVWGAVSRLQREQEKQLRALLGERDDPNQLFEQAMLGRRVDGIPPEKAAAVLAVMRDYDQRRMELMSEPMSILSREGRGALDREQRAALARLLSPRELEEFDLRNSPLAIYMRAELAAFAPTEDEFRTIFRLRDEFARQYESALPGVETAERIRARQEAAQRVVAQIQAALGPVRGEEFTRKADDSYVQASRILERLQQPRENVDAVLAVGRDLTARASALEANRSLDEPARRAQQAELYDEARRRLTPLLGGSTGFEIYRQYGGTWLDKIKPRAPAAVPPPRPP